MRDCSISVRNSVSLLVIFLIGQVVEPNVVLFSRLPIDDINHEEFFSVQSNGHRGAKGRAIVKHEGKETGAGTWVCSKDALGQCQHVKLARDQLQKFLKTDPLAIDEGDVDEEETGLNAQISKGIFSNVFPPVLARYDLL
jgi:hypothetical protein